MQTNINTERPQEWLIPYSCDYFFVYAAHFLRLCSEVIGLSSLPQTGRNIF